MAARGAPVGGRSPVAATWRLPDGTTRAGSVLVPSGFPSVAHVEVWINRSGAVVGAPISGPIAIASGMLVAAGLLIGATALLGGLFHLFVRLFDRRRRRQWDLDWATASRRWRPT